MGETKVNLNYQVDETQFEDKVGTAIESGEAADEVIDQVNTILNDSAIGGGIYEGGHTHDGSLFDGQKVSYDSLVDVPSTFTPGAHTHGFGEVTGDIAFSQLDALVSAGVESDKIIAADDSRLTNDRDPNVHTHVFSDLTDDIIFTQLDSLVSAGTEASKIIAASDSRLTDVRTPVSHNNTYHSETYITTAAVTYETLLANSDIGTSSSQVSQGDHAHNDIYYTKSILDAALSGKAASAHTHSNGDIVAGALSNDVSYESAQARSFSFSPFGFGDWYIQADGTAVITAAGTGTHEYVIPLTMLPDDATITDFTCYVGSAVVHNLSIKLYVTALDGTGASEVASLSHTTAAAILAVTTDVISTGFETVDKNAYHYWVLLDETGSNSGDVEVTGGKIVCEIVKPLP